MNEKLTLFVLEESVEELDFWSPVSLGGSPNLTGGNVDSEEKEDFPKPDKKKKKVISQLT